MDELAILGLKTIGVIGIAALGFFGYGSYVESQQAQQKSDPKNRIADLEDHVGYLTNMMNMHRHDRKQYAKFAAQRFHTQDLLDTLIAKA